MKHALALRMAESGDALIEGWAVPFTSPFKSNRDVYGTIFDGKTDYHLDWYSTRPLTYNHGFDGDIGLRAVGVTSQLSVRDEGVWAEAQISAKAKYFNALCEMARAGQLQFSSGSIDYMVKIDQRSGHVDEWPIAELTLTPIPANPDATLQVVDPDYTVADMRAACRSADLAIAELEEFLGKTEDRGTILLPESYRAKLDAKARDALPDSSFAYIDSKGGRHLPIHDKSHVKAALSRLDQTQFDSAAHKAKAKRKILAAAKKFGVDVASDDGGNLRAAPDSGITMATYTLMFTQDMLDDLPAWMKTDDPAAAYAELTANRAAAGSEAVESEKSFEDIRSDITELLNPMVGGPYDEPLPHYSVVIATYDDTVIVARYCQQSNCCDDDPSYWRIPYTLDENSEPVLDVANQQQMEQVYVPVAAARSADGPLVLESTSFCRHAAALGERTKDLAERRASEQRTLSTTNRQAIERTLGALRSTGEALDALLARDRQIAHDAAEAAYWADPTTQQALELAAFALSLT